MILWLSLSCHSSWFTFFSKVLLDSLLSCSLGAGFAADEGAKDNILICVEFKFPWAMSISDVAKFSPSKLSGFSLPSSVTPEELAKKCGVVVGLCHLVYVASNSSK